jgi:hypothetical protein
MQNLKTFQELEIADAVTRDMIQQFVAHYEDEPKVYFQGESRVASDWDIKWQDDVKFDEEWNMYLPSYTITNFKDNSYSDADTGHNLVPDVTYDLEKEYAESPTATYNEIKEWNESN